MTIFVKINDVRLPAVITGRLNDKDWEGRASKAIKVEMDYSDALAMFVDGAVWFIEEETERTVEKLVDKVETDETGKEHIVQEVVYETITEVISHDNSEYSIAGDITDHRDGTVTIKMGKPTEIELAINTIDELLIAMEV